MSNYRAGLLIAGLAVATTAAVAGGLERADADGDGVVTLAEFEAAHIERIQKHFARIDSDGDGVLSAAEREAAADAHRERRHHRHRDKRRMHDPEQIVEKLDSDGSGSVSLAEFGERRFAPDADAFYAADANGNGELDATELGELIAARRAERSKRQRD